MSQTDFLGLNLVGTSAQDERMLFKDWRQQINGTGDSNAKKIDDAIKQLNDTVDDIIEVEESTPIEIPTMEEFEQATRDIEQQKQNIVELSQSVNDLISIKKWNLAEGAEVIDGKMCNNASQTVGQTMVLATFMIGYTVKVQVEPNTSVYFLCQKMAEQYTSTGYNGKNCARFACYADADDKFIVGYSYPQTGEPATHSVSNVPSNAKYLYVTFTKLGDGTYGDYWITSRGEDDHTDILDIADGVKTKQDVNAIAVAVSDIQKRDVSVSVQGIRKPTFAFIFDDGTDGDTNTKALFDSYGFKCGFALLSNKTTVGYYDRYLTWQNEGYEILSHSINGNAMKTVDAETAELYLKTSLDALKAKGFDIKGFVTPSTWISEEGFEVLKKYYEQGWGHLASNNTETIHVFGGKDVRQLDRWALQTNTIEQTLAKIDACISNNGLLCFYGHSYPQTTDNMTVDNMNTILSYLKDKSDSGEVKVLIPRDAVNDYFSVRYSDFLELLRS